METKKILIIEDEVLVAAETKNMLKNLGYECVGHALNLVSAKELMDNTSFDIALVDLMLGNKKDGIEVARLLKNKKKPFIITSSYSDKATLDEIKELHPNGYIVKPLQESDLFAAIEIIPIENQENSFNFLDDSLFYKDRDLHIKLVFADILYLKSDRNYVEAFTNGKTHLLRITLEEFLEKLPSYFTRVHRCYIVNSKNVSAVGSTIININGNEIPLGKTYKEDFLKKLRIN